MAEVPRVAVAYNKTIENRDDVANPHVSAPIAVINSSSNESVTAPAKTVPRRVAASSSADSGPSDAGSSVLTLYAIPLGIAGLGGVWQALQTNVSAPSWPTEALYGSSTAIWIAMTAAYCLQGARGLVSFSEDRRHRVYGPFSAYIPVIGILLSSHYVYALHAVARVAVVVFVIALGVLATQLLSQWLLGNLPVEDLYPGYLLPTVAGPFIASIGLSASGWHKPAEAAFGLGLFFWAVVGTLIFGRLFARGPLADALKPSLALLVSPPATAGSAWFVLDGGRIDTVESSLLAITFTLLLTQLMLFPYYRDLLVTPSFWSFTFPLAAATSFSVRWLGVERFAYWDVWMWSASGLTTAIIGAIAITTGVTGITRRMERNAKLQRSRK